MLRPGSRPPAKSGWTAFRQSVLAAACSGRLTEDWREQHSADQYSSERNNGQIELPCGCKWLSLGEFLADIEAGRSFTCLERPPSKDEVGVAKISAVTWGEYDEDESKTCTDPPKSNLAFSLLTVSSCLGALIPSNSWERASSLGT